VKIFDNSCLPETKFRRATAIYCIKCSAMSTYVIYRQYNSMENTIFKLVYVMRFPQKFSIWNMLLSG